VSSTPPALCKHAHTVARVPHHDSGINPKYLQHMNSVPSGITGPLSTQIIEHFESQFQKQNTAKTKHQLQSLSYSKFDMDMEASPSCFGCCIETPRPLAPSVKPWCIAPSSLPAPPLLLQPLQQPAPPPVPPVRRVACLLHFSHLLPYPLPPTHEKRGTRHGTPAAARSVTATAVRRAAHFLLVFLFRLPAEEESNSGLQGCTAATARRQKPSCGPRPP